MAEADHLSEQILHRTPIYRSSYLGLDQALVRLPDGQETTRDMVLAPHAVSVLPIDRDRNVHLVRQHRPAIGKTIIEIPAGIIDMQETACEAARRECEEETGMRPGHLRELLTYAHAEGYSSGLMTVFLATELTVQGPVRLDRHEFLEPLSIPFDNLLELVTSGQVIDSKTIISTLLVNYLRLI